MLPSSITFGECVGVTVGIGVGIGVGVTVGIGVGVTVGITVGVGSGVSATIKSVTDNVVGVGELGLDSTVLAFESCIPETGLGVNKRSLFCSLTACTVACTEFAISAF
ncbi:MAG: hypothetical protein FI718_01970 [SAR202 cluster bacterium]|nr:hypothetical protein [SAR202 cluster bacterium]